ncbi:MAG: aconitase/3-isopropylmalate dehydratase large subunit family protein [Myxococcota bacterium]|nr:aconitase/3-isopropylmalate dehydratase large subunit family protein [Myxococcota bacterium]
MVTLSTMSDAPLTHRILLAHCEETLDGSAYFAVSPDIILGHEATIALLIDRLRAAGKRVFAPERCFFAADHFVPPATAERAAILKKYLKFVEDEGISTDLFYRGISHQLLIEDSRCLPGSLIAGADSHTTMAGAVGAFAAGFGSTDILGLLATGKVWVRLPEAVRVDCVNALSEGATGKDVALLMMQHFGEGGAGYRALEFVDHDQGLSMADRCTVTNMAVDCGAKNGLVIPDAVTRAYLIERDGGIPEDMADWSTPGTEYVDTLHIDLSVVVPSVARPGSPADVTPASMVCGERVDQVFIGSCCGGRLEDLRQAAEILAGRRIKSGIRMVVTPASTAVYRAAVEEGIVSILIDAGAMVTASACGACGGIDKGILSAGDVCVSTSNRNFRGRMGSNDARIWLASARTAAAAAVSGQIIDPREVTS